MDGLPAFIRDEELEQFKADREKAIKTHVAKLPSTYFARDYRETHAKHTVTVEVLDGALATFKKSVTKQILTLCNHVSDNITEAGLLVLADGIRELRKEVAALKTVPPPTFADTYKGVWAPATTYARGSVVTRDGGLWLAMSDSGAKPGDDASGWVLIVKRGRDAADRHKHRPGDPA